MVKFELYQRRMAACPYNSELYGHAAMRSWYNSNYTSHSPVEMYGVQMVDCKARYV